MPVAVLLKHLVPFAHQPFAMDDAPRKVMAPAKVMEKKTMKERKKTIKVTNVMTMAQKKRHSPAVVESWHKPVSGAAAPNWALHFKDSFRLCLLHFSILNKSSLMVQNW